MHIALPTLHATWLADCGVPCPVFPNNAPPAAASNKPTLRIKSEFCDIAEPLSLALSPALLQLLPPPHALPPLLAAAQA
ncbi:hypothetical protein C8J57DRAFT_1112869, partial [Mycena rebaudengoi]